MKQISIAIFALMALAGTAGAHATVAPTITKPGAYEKYTLRVPNEKGSSTTRVQIDFPDSLRIVSFADVQGWALEIIMDSSQRITGAVWTGTLPPKRFVEFEFVAVNPKTEQVVSWPVHQIYADGETVDWTGAADSKRPASTSSIIKPSAGGTFATYISIAGLIVSLIALGLVLRRPVSTA